MTVHPAYVLDLQTSFALDDKTGHIYNDPWRSRALELERKLHDISSRSESEHIGSDPASSLRLVLTSMACQMCRTSSSAFCFERLSSFLTSSRFRESNHDLFQEKRHEKVGARKESVFDTQTPSVLHV